MTIIWLAIYFVAIAYGIYVFANSLMFTAIGGEVPSYLNDELRKKLAEEIVTPDYVTNPR